MSHGPWAQRPSDSLGIDNLCEHVLCAYTCTTLMLWCRLHWNEMDEMLQCVFRWALLGFAVRYTWLQLPTADQYCYSAKSPSFRSGKAQTNWSFSQESNTPDASETLTSSNDDIVHATWNTASKNLQTQIMFVFGCTKWPDSLKNGRLFQKTLDRFTISLRIVAGFRIFRFSWKIARSLRLPYDFSAKEKQIDLVVIATARNKKFIFSI